MNVVMLISATKYSGKSMLWMKEAGMGLSELTVDIIY